ncbi:ATP-binding cassette domain-containing protein [Streptomyces sp. NPDC050988]|uniref:ATP-binding cassette domain-containing protein n=1 Tax=Streptomyces sp. NPDC050988 TaxID=3365637 RepID=UPI0037A099C3
MSKEMAAVTTAAPLLELRQVVKLFGGVHALEGIDLSVRHGEIVAVVGDNGAGKSTLMKIISGLQPADGGEILFDGEQVELRRPVDSTALGIETVYQDLALCDNLDTVQNLFLGREETGPFLRGARLRRADMEHRAQETIRRLGAKIPSLRTPVGRLSGGQRQSIAVCRSTLSDPRLVLMDEPTAALGVEQSTGVLNLIRQLRAEHGCAIVLISHALRDVLEVADRIVVLRLGNKVAEFDNTERTTNSDQLVAAITGISAP